MLIRRRASVRMRVQFCQIAPYCLVLMAGCAGTGSTGGGSPANTPPTDGETMPIRNPRLRAVDDWLYQLQGSPQFDLARIAATPFDLVVMAYSADGTAEAEFTAVQIASLRAGGDPSRVILAYMSIGEAELGRFYFDPAWVRP